MARAPETALSTPQPPRDGEGRHWAVGAVPIANAKGRVDLAGWTDGTFGLDFRVADGAAASEINSGIWALTHLATGRLVCGIAAPLDQAQGFVAMLHAAADWSNPGPGLGKQFKECSDAFGADDIYRGAHNFSGPYMLSRAES